MSSSIFLNNVVVASWQIYTPILVVLSMVVWYKFSRFAREHLLFIYTLFLIAFIPLYPKLPLEGIRNTFVYIRLDDVFVAIGVCLWLFYLIKHKISFKSPLTIPIVLYWIIGLLATILGVIFIFPSLANVFPHSAFLFYLRHIEYLSLFFIAYASVQNKKNSTPIAIVIVLTVLLVVGYAFGQRFIPTSFPAFETMNEQFAKGYALILGSQDRIAATFAGHYDLAAYLVMLLPIIGSLVFGFKKWWVKISLIILGILSVIVLLMTASRTSFAMYALAIVFMLILQKQKKWILPTLIVSFLLLYSFQGLYGRYAETVRTTSILYGPDGKPLAEVTKVGNTFVVDKTQQLTGNLPVGSSVISSNPSQQNVAKPTTVIVKQNKNGVQTYAVQKGDFTVRNVQTLDISASTRLQAEWPNAIKAFLRDPLFGSGYSSITLATDGNYFRFLGETGFLGFSAFFLIFIIYGIYVYRVLPEVTSPLTRSLVLGISAGIFGLALNAILIDVFEASKDAYVLWLLVGVSLGLLHQYQKQKINYLGDIKKMFVSVPAIFVYLGVTASALFYSTVTTFFVADDFTWLRWVTDCKMINNTDQCSSIVSNVLNFFLKSNNFFYRPAEKIYFSFLYKFFSLNPLAYHTVSLLLHLAIAALIFCITNTLLRKKFWSLLVAFLFLILSVHAEAIYWISSSGHLFASFFILLGLYLFMLWKENKKIWYLLLSAGSIFLAPLFHEAGVIGILMIFGYDLLSGSSLFSVRKLAYYRTYLLYILPLLFYFILKIISHSFWSAGDYQYNVLKLPLNALANGLGSIGIALFGNPAYIWYEQIRFVGRNNLIIVILLAVTILALLYIVYREIKRSVSLEGKRILLLGCLFFIVPLLPFLGLGNIAFRYVYLSSFGLLFIVIFILEGWYSYLKRQTSFISAFVIMSLLIAIFSVYQIYQLESANLDWQKAGGITNNTLTYMGTIYPEIYQIKNPSFYFVNVPIQYGQAWIFPVGLQDAVWFDFKTDFNFYTVSTLDEALQKSAGVPNAKIFIFDKNYNVTEYKQPTILP